MKDIEASKQPYSGFVLLNQGKRIHPTELSPQDIPRHLVITGSGRGGTTACAVLARELGFNAERPTPYHESPHLRAFIKNADVVGALEHIRAWPPSGERMFWKDPKIHAPKFRRFLTDMPQNIGVMMVFRDPLNIAIRNTIDMGIDFFEAITKAARSAEQMTQCIQSLSTRVVILISYEKLLVKAEKIVSQLALTLGVDSEEKIRSAIMSVAPTPDAYQALTIPVLRGDFDAPTNAVSS